MTGKKLQRLLACLLAVLLLSQVGAFLPATRAAGGYSLQNGSAIIKPAFFPCVETLLFSAHPLWKHNP